MADKYKVKVEFPAKLGTSTHGPMSKEDADFLRSEMEALGAKVTIFKVVK